MDLDPSTEVPLTTRTTAIDTSSILPSQIVVRDLTYSVDVRDPGFRKSSPLSRPPLVEKTILKQINVVFQPGRLTAILGASGAGKTSLLYAIAGTLSHGHVSGNIMVNGEDVAGPDLKKLSGFVFQDDLLFPTMTVRESLTQSATLRLPEPIPRAEKDRRVDETIKELRLDPAADTVVGSHSVKGISGGERKRLCIGMELITNPAVLFLDEPTSGLDSFTAFSVVELLKHLSSTGRTIVTTIHQPSSEIFQLFDDVLVLAQGSVLYHGPMSHVVPYFSKHGFECPQYSNPADFLFMSVLNPKLDPSPVPGLVAAFKADSLYEEVARAIDKPARGGISKDVLKQQAGFGTQFSFLYMRAFRNATRNKLMLRARAGQVIFLNVLIGLIYLNIPGRDRAGLLFFLSVANLLTAMLNVLAIFALERTVFEREHGAGYYGLPSYFLSKISVELPYQIILPFIGTTISYWMAGFQRTGEHYIVAVLYCILMSLCGFALGILFGSIFPSIEIALAIVPMVFMPLLLFTGLLVNNSTIPPYLDWLKWLAPTKYGFEGLFQNEFSTLLLPVVGDPSATYPGNVAVAQFGLDRDGLSRWSLFVILASFVVALLGLAYLGLLRLVVASDGARAQVRSATRKVEEVEAGSSKA
ncbi:hypothetical protein M427DRAFT_32237 [Gonapodya prolifera JEL478]|uniref:ABC transporter domain-containing protein n=1 Tax=Gonapodya prolifera (strain JEL478) TaxID=1344416 RepID=A0A139AGK4_GONPJ|nr:hypothetical protein M427DRAFT_32237 [Gonapodya prolifera JEL478]|eukprot:KXS15543.1 hypothetical protein M427DRAFT_32237 [Gonapodya prolifera JEL478]